MDFQKIKPIYLIGGGVVLLSVILAFVFSPKKKTKRKTKRRKKTTTRSTTRSSGKKRTTGGKSLRAEAGIRKDKKESNFTDIERKRFNMAKARRARRRNLKNR